MIDFLDELDREGDIETAIYDDLSQCFQKSKSNRLGIIHFNIRSMHKNFEELLIYIESELCNIDIIILSETWNMSSVNNYFIPLFSIHYNESKFNNNDGLIVYTKNTLNIKNVIIQKFSECNILRINLTVDLTTIGITASYRPPSTDMNLYIADLGTYLSKLQKLQVEFFLGDININLNDKHSNKVNLYVNTLTEHGYISYINTFTRVSETSKSIIDHIFARTDTTVKNEVEIKPMMIKTDLTDHYSIGATIAFNQKLANKTTDKENIFKSIDYVKLNKHLEKEHWNDVLQHNNIKNAYDTFINKFTDHLDRATKIRTINNNTTKKLKPWITTGLIKSIRHRDKLKNRLRKNYSTQLKDDYKNYRNKLCKLIKYTKNSYYKQKLLENGNNYKKTWQIINETTNTAPKNTITNKSSLTDHNGTEITENQSKADFFNDHFAKIGQRMAEDIENNFLLDTDKSRPFTYHQSRKMTSLWPSQT
ncbi:hypothetical protein JTB14_023806 [Gonioctena quinquepunctata]|nr:hypothetical protein JTB14_023806 [Gonioctena quinquepunctata]